MESGLLENVKTLNNAYTTISELALIEIYTTNLHIDPKHSRFSLFYIFHYMVEHQIGGLVVH